MRHLGLMGATLCVLLVAACGSRGVPQAAITIEHAWIRPAFALREYRGLHGYHQSYRGFHHAEGFRGRFRGEPANPPDSHRK